MMSKVKLKSKLKMIKVKINSKPTLKGKIEVKMETRMMKNCILKRLLKKQKSVAWRKGLQDSCEMAIFLIMSMVVLLKVFLLASN